MSPKTLTTELTDIAGLDGEYGWSPVYSDPGFSRFLEDGVGGEARCLAARRGGRMAGVFIFFRRRVEKYGTVLGSLPWFGSYGGCALAPGEGSEARQALLEAFRRELAAEPELLGSAVSLPPPEYEARAHYIEALRPIRIEPRRLQVLRLPPNDGDVRAAVIARMDAKHRWNARKSLKQGFLFQRADHDDQAWEFLMATHAENMRAIGVPAKPVAHFRALRRHIRPENLRLALVELDGRPVAALLCLNKGRTIEYLIPAIAQSYRHLDPLTFLILEEMTRAVGEGFDLWNFGGTPFDSRSLHFFKAGWGAVDLPYGYLINGDEGRLSRLMREEPEALLAAFPYYYLYPRS